jgi:hypothetical protein
MIYEHSRVLFLAAESPENRLALISVAGPLIEYQHSGELPWISNVRYDTGEIVYEPAFKWTDDVLTTKMQSGLAGNYTIGRSPNAELRVAFSEGILNNDDLMTGNAKPERRR